MIFDKERRVIGEDEIKKILVNLKKFSNLKTTTDNDIYNTVTDILRIENAIEGRFAGDIVDYILLYWLGIHACRKAIENGNESINFLEIGSLFGASTILLREAIISEKLAGTITSIDPLDGYYMHDRKSYSSRIDSGTNLEVNEKNFWSNLNKFPSNKIKVKQIKDLSQSLNARAYSKKQLYDLVFIDGDHSKTGLQNDIRIHGSRLKRNGVLIVDNVFDRNWPEVGLGIYDNRDLESKFTPKIFGKRSMIMLKQNDGSGKIDRSIYVEMMGKIFHELCESRSEAVLVGKKLELLKEEYQKKLMDFETLTENINKFIRKFGE